MSSMVPRSAPYDCPIWPHSEAPYSPIQEPLFKREPSVIGKWARYQNDQHDEMSSMVPRSAPYDCPIQPHSSLVWPHSEPPIQNPHTGALFKREPLVIGKWARYQNDQHDEMSSMVPRSAPYDYPVQPLFKPLMAPFKTPIQIPHSGSPFKGDNFPIQHHKIHQSIQLNKQRKCILWDLLSTADSPTNGTAKNMFRVYIYWKIMKQ